MLFTETFVLQTNPNNECVVYLTLSLALHMLLREGKGNLYSNAELKLVLEKCQCFICINFRITCKGCSHILKSQSYTMFLVILLLSRRVVILFLAWAGIIQIGLRALTLPTLPIFNVLLNIFAIESFILKSA